MRPVRVTVYAPGNSVWIPVNYLQVAFNIGLGVIPWSTAAGLSCLVQHTFDDLDTTGVGRPITISRAGTTATVTDNGIYNQGHGLSTGDCIFVTGGGPPFNTPSLPAPQGGDFGADIVVVNNNTYTYQVANTGPLVDNGMARVVSVRVFPHATLTAVSARADGNYAFSIRACRLKVTALTGGAVDLDLLQGMGR